MRITAGLLALAFLLLGSTAYAQMDDDEYITRYFGTTLQINTTDMPYDPDVDGWWGYVLPEDLLYNAAYISGIVNAGRTARGESRMLSPMDNPVEAGGEEYLADGFRYNLNFKGMRPSEVEAVLATFGGIEEIISGASTSYEPLRTASFYYDTYGEEEGLNVRIGDDSIAVTRDMLASELRDSLLAMYESFYQTEVQMEFYYGQGFSQYGDSISLSLTVSLVDEEEETTAGGPDF